MSKFLLFTGFIHNVKRRQLLGEMNVPSFDYEELKLFP